MRVRQAEQRGRGFTLVELLVVIGIIAVLLALLLPALGAARRSARVVKCATNQRQIAIAWLLYLEEHQQIFPVPPAQIFNWHLYYGGKHPSIHPPNFAQARFLNPYVDNKEKNTPGSAIFQCPEDRGIVSFDGTKSPTDFYPAYEYYGLSYPANFVLLNMQYRSSDPRRQIPVQVENIQYNLSRVILTGDYQWLYALTNAPWDAQFHNDHDQVNLAFLDGHVNYTQMKRGEAITSKYVVLVRKPLEEEQEQEQ